MYLTSELETAAFQRVLLVRVSINYMSYGTYTSQSMIVSCAGFKERPPRHEDKFTCCCCFFLKTQNMSLTPS